MNQQYIMELRTVIIIFAVFSVLLFTAKGKKIVDLIRRSMESTPVNRPATELGPFGRH